MYHSKQEILEKSQEAIGKKIVEYDINDRLNNGGNKGGIGHVIEEGLFGYEINSNSEADFKELGVELKVTPYKKNKNNSFSSKERLVLNVIDFEKEYQYDFENSSFWKKNQSILLMLYLFVPEIHKGEYEITHSLLFEYPEEDLEIIRNDWNTIIDKIKQGKAHELSESDTLYLGACTKGANKKSQRTQPFSDEFAMQRAFSLKQSYMTHLLRTYILGDELNEKIIRNPNELKNNSFEQVILNKLKQYYGKSQQELKEIFNVKSNAKSINEILVARMLGVNGKVSKTSEFMKANIVTKTIRIEQNGTIKEHMSFPNFKFKEIVEQEWEHSDLYNMFFSTRFLLVIFRYNEDAELVFKECIFWSVPYDVLNKEIKETWIETKRIINSGVVLISMGNRMTNNLPGSVFNNVCHVRPKAKKSSYIPSPDSDELPGGIWMTKQSFWLDKKYILNNILTHI